MPARPPETPQDRRSLAAEWLDAAKAAMMLKSDYALARRLEVAPATLQGIRRGGRSMPLILIVKLAITLERDPLVMIAEMQLLSERHPQRLDFWRSFIWRAVRVAVRACTRGFGCFGSCVSGREVAGGLTAVEG